MFDTATIIIVVIALVFLGVIFFIADFLTRESKKAEKKEEVRIEKKEIKNEIAEAARDDHKISELNSNNLANDIEKLIDYTEKKEVDDDSFARRSRIINTRRMRDYYERRQTEHSRKYEGYGINDGAYDENVYRNEQEDANQVNANITVGDKEMSKDQLRLLMAEMLNRNDWD